MSTAESQVKVRPMSLLDLESIFSIDQAIRASEISVTYSGFTTPQMFRMDQAHPDGRPDILEIAKLADLGLVAESGGNVCGFVLGRQTYLAERDIHEGEIAIIGVHPDYQGKGVAAKLVSSICDLLRSRGARRVRIGLDLKDTKMQGFFERAGFSGQELIYYHKTL